MWVGGCVGGMHVAVFLSLSLSLSTSVWSVCVSVSVRLSMSVFFCDPPPGTAINFQVRNSVPSGE